MDKFEQNCIRLANMLGCQTANYEDIPQELRIFFEGIGHMRVCAVFVITDLKEGKSERRVARIYGLTRPQVRTIRSWSKRVRPKVGE